MNTHAFEMEESHPKKRRGLLKVGLVLLIVGVLLGIGGVGLYVVGLVGMIGKGTPTPLAVPGVTSYTADAPGEVVVWRLERDTWGIDELDLTVLEAGSGLEVPRTASPSQMQMTQTITVNNVAYQSVASYTLDNAGGYDFVVGTGGTPGLEAYISPGIDISGIGLLFLYMCSGGVGFLMAITGLVLVIVHLVTKA